MRQTRQPIEPGDVFGKCPKCGERWELVDPNPASGSWLTPDSWECDHCGFTLSLAGCATAVIALIDYHDAELYATAYYPTRQMMREAHKRDGKPKTKRELAKMLDNAVRLARAATGRN